MDNYIKVPFEVFHDKLEKYIKLVDYLSAVMPETIYYLSYEDEEYIEEHNEYVFYNKIKFEDGGVDIYLAKIVETRRPASYYDTGSTYETIKEDVYIVDPMPSFEDIKQRVLNYHIKNFSDTLDEIEINHFKSIVDENVNFITKKSIFG